MTSILILGVKDSLVKEMAKVKPAMNFKFSKDDKGKVIFTVQYTYVQYHNLTLTVHFAYSIKASEKVILVYTQYIVLQVILYLYSGHLA